jgi:hypothetical protein
MLGATLDFVQIRISVLVTFLETNSKYRAGEEGVGGSGAVLSSTTKNHKTLDDGLSLLRTAAWEPDRGKAKVKERSKFLFF